MSRDLFPDILTAIGQDTLFPFIAVQMNFDSGTLRLWNGYGTKTINGSLFYGAGSLLGVSSVQETSELSSVGATVSLSGVPSDMLSLAIGEKYQGRKAYIYLGTINNPTSWIMSNGTWIDGALWLDTASWSDYGASASQIFSGYLDQMNIDEQPDTSTITVTIESKLIDLERVRSYNYTSETQKAAYPDDLGFDFVESLQGKTYNWGRV